MPTGRGSQGRKRKGKPFARGSKKGPRKVRRAEEVLFDENDRKRGKRDKKGRRRDSSKMRWKRRNGVFNRFSKAQAAEKREGAFR
eukprot:1391600-Amorphochlora_amoeboformis.AAC.1